MSKELLQRAHHALLALCGDKPLRDLDETILAIEIELAAPAPVVPLTDDMVEAEFVSRGDDKGQGLHPYWKDAFRDGFNFARSQLSAAPVVREPNFGNKRAIFQAGRDSYKTACQPMNTDDEAWDEYLRGIGGGGK